MFPTGLYAGMMRVHRGATKNGIQVRARLMLWPPPSSLEDDLRRYDFLLGVYRDLEAMSGLNPKKHLERTRGGKTRFGNASGRSFRSARASTSSG